MRQQRWMCVFCSLAVLASVGCRGVSSSAIGGSPKPAPALSGLVRGGQQGVSGANVQLYAVGTTGDGSAAIPLLVVPVTTDVAGNFSITSDYVCPSGDTEVYLVASGGNPGLVDGTNNPALAMLAGLGMCSQLQGSTFIFVNELTTVGTLAALSPYASGYAGIGSGTGDASALASSFATVNEYTWIAGGTVPGPSLPSGFYASSVEIATLADILSVCVDSAGGVAKDGSSCGSLFDLATPSGGTAPTDTVGATIDILKNPTHNVAGLFSLTPARGAPFQPTLSAAPTDWTLPIVPDAATPTFSEPAGVYRGNQMIALSESVPGATVYYTLDGSVPTLSSTVYSGPILVSSPMTINAVASYTGRTMSPVASGRFLVAPAADAPPVGSVVPQSSNGSPNTVIVSGNFEFVTVQGTGQIFTYDISTGYQLLAVPPYSTPCTSPSGMKIATIQGVTVMAVVCYDTNQLLTLQVAADGSLSALGSVSGVPVPYPGIDLVGTDVYVPLHGTVGAANGGVAKVSLANPATPVVTATMTLASTAPGEYVNPGYLVASDGYLYVAAGSESAPTDTSSSIQVVEESTMMLVGTPFVVAHSPQQIAKSGNVVYVTIYDAQQMVSIDATDPSNLVGLQVLLMNSPQCNGIPLVVNAGVAYVGCYGENAVEKVDVSHPAAMVPGATVAVTAPQRIVMSGTQLFVASGTSNGPVTRIDTTSAF